MLKAISFNDFAIVFVRRNDYRTDFWFMSKDEAINLLKNSDLTGKMWNIIKHKKFIITYKRWVKK